MQEDNAHSHHHAPKLTHVSRAFIIGIVLNSAFVLIEFGMGLYTNSMALLSDAGHNLSDVASLGLALFALQISKSKATEKFTYGYHKSTILASLVNAVILLIAVGSIGWESVQRFMHPVATQGSVISIVAGIGIVVNTVSALLFFRDRKSDINVRGAYLHLAVDALVSAGVVVAGIIITYTGLTWIDPAISLIIMVVVTVSTWQLLAESLRLTLDAVPENIDMDKVTEVMNNIEGIKSVHHIHIWAMSTTKNAMTAHLVMEDTITEMQVATIKHHLKHELERENIQHVTLETEWQKCKDEKCGDEGRV